MPHNKQLTNLDRSVNKQLVLHLLKMNTNIKTSFDVFSVDLITNSAVDKQIN